MNIFKGFKKKENKKNYILISMEYMEWARPYVELLADKFAETELTVQQECEGGNYLTTMKVDYSHWFELQTKLDPRYITEYRATRWI